MTMWSMFHLKSGHTWLGLGLWLTLTPALTLTQTLTLNSGHTVTGADSPSASGTATTLP
jgi:hypothetical protein